MGKSTQIISILSLKGGVGKSCISNILSLELALIIAQQGGSDRILLVDVDVQHTNAEKRKLDISRLKLSTDSLEYQSLSEKEKLDIRQFQFRYALLCGTLNFTPYSVLNVDTTDHSSIIRAIEIIEKGEYTYIILDFPGSLEQPGTDDFYDMINHMIIPLTSNPSDILGVERFMSEIKDIGLPRSLKSKHFIINKYEFMKRKATQQLKEDLSERYNIPFLKTHIRDTPSFDSNTILPLSVKINLSTSEISDSSSLDLRDFAKEVLTITNKINNHV